MKQPNDEIINQIKVKILEARNLITFVEKKIEMTNFLTININAVTIEIIKYVRGIFLNRGKRNINVFNFSGIYDRYFSPGKKQVGHVNVIDQLINFINNINYFKDKDAYIYQLAINTAIIQNAIFNISYKGDT